MSSRRRRDDSDDENKLEIVEDDDYVEYVPLKKRKQERLHTMQNKIFKEEEEARRRKEEARAAAIKAAEEEKARRERKTLQTSLLAKSEQLRAQHEARKEDREVEKLEEMKQEEDRILEQVQLSLSTPLMSLKERAKGVVYTTRMEAIGGWRPNLKHRKMTQEAAEKLREKYFIEVNGVDVPPPLKLFKDMRLPDGIMNGLREKGIQRPTQIQMQGLPTAFSGRDMIGIAFTGSGKTISFTFPMIFRSMELEMKQKVGQSEGPFALCIAPSRELAHQIYESIDFYAGHLAKARMPALKTVLLIGGTNSSEQAREMRNGIHMAVATPGRLNDMLNKKKMHLLQCKILALDEADRMIDLGFEEEIRNVLDNFGGQRQTLLYSATMPKKIQDFAKSALVDAVVVNVGRAGAANLDVVQEVEYVKQESKLVYLLTCLQKTPPPVLIFCDNKSDVDDCHEYLLLKGVEAVAIHGGLSQEDRLAAIKGYKDGRKDVLIGTDVASKGLDFPAIQHVINYDMPKEIEDYVHRIGRTGRCGRTGVATTFINKNQEETILLDLRALLLEANQKVPPFLMQLESPHGFQVKELGGVKGCAYCGGLGHRVAVCPKLEATRNRAGGTGKDYLQSGSRYGGDAGYGGEW